MVEEKNKPEPRMLNPNSDGVRTYDPSDPNHPINAVDTEAQKTAQDQLEASRNPRVEEGLPQDHGKVTDYPQKPETGKEIGGQPVQTQDTVRATSKNKR